MWVKIITIKRTKDLNYFSLCALNLFNTQVSQFELSYWNKLTCPQHSNLLRCTCHVLTAVLISLLWNAFPASKESEMRTCSEQCSDIFMIFFMILEYFYNRLIPGIIAENAYLEAFSPVALTFKRGKSACMKHIALCYICIKVILKILTVYKHRTLIA